MKYRFLLMDADKTLLDFDADMMEAFRETYRHCFEAQRPYSPDLVACYEEHNEGWWRKFERGECTKPELFEGRFRDFMEHTGLTGNPEEINALYFHFLGQGGQLLPGALPLVKRLSLKADIYILTNGNASSQKTRLEHSGLLPYVKNTFISETVGAGKPSLPYFDYVFSSIPDFQKASAIMIGDSLTSDILGANNAHIHSLWFNPEHLPADPAISFTYEADSFSAMEEILNGTL